MKLRPMFCYCQHLWNLNTSNFLMLEISSVNFSHITLNSIYSVGFFCLFLCLLFAKISKVVKSKEKNGNGLLSGGGL